MKTIVIFTANNNEINLIQELKAKIILYMGGRSIEDECPNTPHIILKGPLTNEDRTAISQMMEKFQSICMLTIEAENANILSNYILDLKIVDNEMYNLR